MSWKLAIVEIALIIALVIISCYCNLEELAYIVCRFLMIVIVCAPFIYWGYHERLMYLKRKEKELEHTQLQLGKKHVKELSDLLKNINRLSSKIEKCEEKYSDIKKEIESIKK